MANANSGLTQFKELHIMRVGKTWGWSARRYCIKLVTFLKNILCPHRAFTKASDFTSQIAVSNPPYDRNISSFREFVSFRIWVVPFLLLSHPRSQCPETLGFSCLCCMPSHPFDTVRVSPGHPQITTPPPACLNLIDAQDHIQARESKQGRFMKVTKNCMIHTGTLEKQSISLFCQFLLKLAIRNWLNNLKKNRCSSVTQRQVTVIWKESSAQIQAERKHLYSKRQYAVYSILQAKMIL